MEKHSMEQPSEEQLKVELEKKENENSYFAGRLL